MRVDRFSNKAPARWPVKAETESGCSRRRKIDMFYIPPLAAFSGSASGTLASIVTGWVTQRRRDRARLTSRTISQREELYKSFIEEASRLYADAIVRDISA